MATTVGGQQWQRIDSTPEAVAGVRNASPAWDSFRVVGGGFGLRGQKATIDTSEEACTVSQPAPSLSHTVPRGSINVIPSPWDTGMDFGGSPTRGFLRFLLDWALQRTNGVLDSHTIHRVANDIVTQEFLGLKPNSLSLGFDAGGAGGSFLNVSADLLGMFMGRLTDAARLDAADCGTFPSSRHWIVAQCGAQIGDDLNVSTTDRTLRALQIEMANNLKEGAPIYTYGGSDVQESVRTGLQEVTEGDLKITGSFEVALEDAAWFDRYMESGAVKVGAIRLLCFHPDSALFTITGAGLTTNPAADQMGEVAENPSGANLIGAAAYLEDSTAADPTTWSREVLQVVSTQNTPTFGIEFDCDESNEGSLGRNITYATSGASRIYTAGMTLMLGEVKVTDWEPVGAVDEKVRQRVTFEAQTPAGWSLPIKYLVR